MKFEPQAKLLWHGDRVKNWLDTNKSAPILIEVSPTGYCNAKCPWCFFNGKKSAEKIDKDIMIQAIIDMTHIGVKAINWSGGGEPTLHPYFKAFITIANKLGLKQGLFTNGYDEIPCQEMFEWIRISVTDNGLENIKVPSVPFGICMNQIIENTEKEIRENCVKAKNIGASYFQIRPALIGSYEEQPSFSFPSYLNEYTTDSFKIHVTDYKYKESILPKTYKDCYGFHFCPSINYKGHVSVCLYLSHKEDYVLGDLNVDYLEEIIDKFPDKAKVINECQNCCKNHEINKILYNVKNIEAVDFL